jgi:transcriptional regulator with GAF, ATPase, and Fis domain
MEMAREQMNMLYAGSERVVQANSIEEVLNALVDSTELKQMDTANLIFFNKPWAETPPDTLTITALWQKTPGITPEHVGDSYEMARFPSFLNMNRDKTTLYLDVKNTEHLEADVKMMSEYLGMNCVLYNPLIVSNQWIGILSAKAKNSVHLTDEDLKQMSSLADQAASIAQNQYVFTQTQARARREQLLREVGAKVYAAPDAKTILKTTAQEINRIMGVDAFVYLDDPAAQQPTPANGHPLAASETTHQEG